MRDAPAATVDPGGPQAPSGRVGLRRAGPGRAGRGAAAAAAGLAVFAALALAVVRGGWVTEGDADVAAWVARAMPVWAEWVARPLTWIGGPLGVVPLTTAAAVLLARARRRLDALFVAVSVAGITVIVALLKSAFGRPRPDVGSAVALPESSSFPSGHAATAAVLFGALALLACERAPTPGAARRRIAAGLLLALAVAASRVVLDVHYVSDVVAGLAVGVFWLGSLTAARALLVSPPGPRPAGAAPRLPVG